MGLVTKIRTDIGLFAFLLSVFFLAIPGVGGADLLSVYTVNYPLKYFAERIGGAHVTVILPVPADVDPAFWKPGLAEIAAYQQADLILLNGAGYAKWTRTVSLPRAKTVDTAKAFKERLIARTDVLSHSHGTEGEHTHEDLAFTIWLDFSLAREQAQAVARALIRKRPQLKTAFQTNLDALLTDLEALDQALMALAAADPGRPLMASHPVYDYLAARYGFNIASVHWEPEEVPGDGDLAALQTMLNDHPARWMIWEGEPHQGSVAKLAAIGLAGGVFDPCGNTPETGDFLTTMQRNIENLKPAFELE